MQLIKVIEEALNKPSIPYEPEKHSLKAWAMYCLRDRGFKLVYAQNADFAVESRGIEKAYFKVTTNPEDLDASLSWIVLDRSNNSVKVIPAQS